PSIYGEFTLIQSLAQFMSIPMHLGIGTALIKYSAEKSDFNRQRIIISTTYVTIFILTNISLLFYFAFSYQIQKITLISEEIFWFSVILGVLFVGFTLTTSTLRGLHEMKKYSVFRPIYNIFLLISFFGFAFINLLGLESLILSMCIAYGITATLIILFFVKKYLKVVFNLNWAIKIMRYSFYAIIGSLASIIYTNIDKLLIDRYMTITDVGIYGAYYWAFLTFTTLFSSTFVTVLFPVASSYPSKEIFFKKLNRIIPVFCVLGFPLITTLGIVIIEMYGDQYPFDLGLTILFGITAIFMFINSLYVWLMNAVGNQGVKITSTAVVLLVLVNITLNIALIPPMGLIGAIMAKLIAVLISTVVVLSKREYYSIIHFD
ncbi:MAG: oligosaccharide flippase family protein, partial [Candidatus Hermodarchaeota archaeon]